MELLIAIALILVGLGLIIAEVYLIPGLNVVGIGGAVLIIFGIGYTFSESGMLAGVLMTIGSMGAFGGSFWVMAKTGAWQRFVLAASLKQDPAAIARDSEHRSRLLGKMGTALSPLRPTGVADIDGVRIEVVTEGDFISAGSRVKVVAMDRRRYFVRLADESEPVPATAPTN